ncbi:MAG: hypothetical protein ACOZAO_02620 [Patescibacteria group bacterium]
MQPSVGAQKRYLSLIVLFILVGLFVAVLIIRAINYDSYSNAVKTPEVTKSNETGSETTTTKINLKGDYEYVMGVDAYTYTGGGILHNLGPFIITAKIKGNNITEAENQFTSEMFKLQFVEEDKWLEFTNFQVAQKLLSQRDPKGNFANYLELAKSLGTKGILYNSYIKQQDTEEFLQYAKSNDFSFIFSPTLDELNTVSKNEDTAKLISEAYGIILRTHTQIAEQCDTNVSTQVKRTSAELKNINPNIKVYVTLNPKQCVLADKNYFSCTNEKPKFNWNHCSDLVNDIENNIDGIYIETVTTADNANTPDFITTLSIN